MKDLERGRRARHPGDRGDLSSYQLRRQGHPCGCLLCTVGKGTN